MTNRNFPKFTTTPTDPYVESLKNYNLPDFILKLVAKECNSFLVEKGKPERRLQSLNKRSLQLLYKIFVECDEEKSGKYAMYRFYAYVSSMYYKCNVLINEVIPGASGKNHKIPIAVKNNGMYIAVAYNKATGNQVNKLDVIKFYNIVDDLKRGDHGTMLTEAIFGSSVGFKGEALVELEKLSKSRTKDHENKLEFKTANFADRIYSLLKC